MTQVREQIQEYGTMRRHFYQQEFIKETKKTRLKQLLSDYVMKAEFFKV